jgi:lysyl-tRNA synthetase, class II
MTDNQDNGQDENIQIAQRRAKLAQLREQGIAFPNDFRRNVVAGELQAEYGERAADALEAQPVRVRVAGRMMTRRVMGKASFAHLQDMSGRIQLYVQRDAVGTEVYDEFKKWDLGDILGAEGTLFKTKTGELSVKVEALRLLTKALRPLPEKFHGLTDQETRYRQRYLDLIMNDVARRTFRLRAEIVAYLRRFLDARGFLEVETPMMQAIPGGAAARPFVTTTTPWTCSCSCASRRSSTSSAWWWAASRRSTRSTAISATRACRRATTPNSPCSSSTRPTPITAT